MTDHETEDDAELDDEDELDEAIEAELAAERVEQAKAREAFADRSGIDAERWRAKLTAAKLPDEAISRLLSLSRPGARLIATPVTDSIPCGNSKLGGAPDLPQGSAWPSKGKRPLAFVLQLRLSDVSERVREALHLPAMGC
ncbi:MAG: DUF1963 domain-containing protein [Polyangiaceae bacterium]|nr:DUF1963 domain-containing protein [Polyangiaceae bacterium]MCW5789181.1 DUF1963 domain-containing protein [Polyangiaceae bacterium]